MYELVTELATGIDRDLGKQGEEPCVAGTRVPIRRIGNLVGHHGAEPTATAEHYGITLSDVHRALAYYYDHPDEMERYDRRDDERERYTADTAGEAKEDVETFEEACDRLEERSWVG